MRLTTLVYIWLALCLPCHLVFAQQGSYSTKSKKAIKLYEESEYFMARRMYPQALNVLQEALEKDTSFIEAHLRAAFCYKTLNSVDQQIPHLESVLYNTNDQSRYKNVYYTLGEAYYLVMKYDLAENMISRFLEFPGLNQRLEPEAVTLLENIRFARKGYENPLDIQPRKLPEIINAGPMQYFPVLTADEQRIFFTFRSGFQPGYDENIFMSEKDDRGNWQIPVSISPNINTRNNEGTCTISADGRVLIFTSCMGRGSYGGCDLFISYREGNDWSVPKNMGQAINSASWDSQPSLSADGRRLYFVSDRPGGVGNRDIWVSYLDRNEKWQPAVNLGSPINSRLDEVSPFIHVNGQTLYFSSNGFKGYGGYDLYFAEFDKGKWQDPVNLGYPVNTPEDQISLFVSANGARAYYSLDTYNEDGFPLSNLYMFDMPVEITVSKKSYYVKGVILDEETGDPLKANVELIDVNNDSLISRVASDSLWGEYTMVLTEGSEYALYVDRTGYIFESRHFNLPKGSPYEPVIMNFKLKKSRYGAITTLNNIFFDTDKYDLKDKSITELHKIISFLTKYPGIKIEIGGHTDDTGTEAYNLGLSEKRAEAVYGFLVANKIDPTRMAFKGYGQNHPAFPNDSEENRAKNRRIEFKIIDL